MSSKARQKGIRKVFACAFAFLFLIQAFVVFSFNTSSAQATEYQGIERGVADLCEKAGSNQAHRGNHCDHIGFCVLCSVQERSHEAFAAAILQVASIVVQIEPTTAGPAFPYENRRLNPPRQFGWKATWSATAPPRV